jgi:multiple sugar transport system ATP-binding protein
MTMGHRVAVLSDARLQQVDTPRNLYEKPANVFVAGFIGSPAMNLRVAKLAPDGASIGDATLPLPAETLRSARTDGADEVVIGLRPESGALAPAGTPETLTLTVTLVEELGADAYVYGNLSGDTAQDKAWVIRCDGRAVPRIGDRVGVSVQTSAAHLFNGRTGLRLN